MDKGVTTRLYGNYRAKVVENKDEEMFGRVLLWIPDLMPTIPENEGIWARPANNPIGGRNMQYEDENHYMGSCMIPRKGAWVFCFFESGNINRPYYFAGLDIEQAKVLPENQVGTNFEDKWTIFKSHDGRAIVISDDPDDARTEITGKKRQMNNPPSGDKSSVYQIDQNQTTILFDERSGKEKILIRTRKGDFFHVDIDERKLQAEFANDIEIKTGGDLNLTADGDINIKSLTEAVYIQSDTDEVDIKAGNHVKIQSEDLDVHIKAGRSIYEQAISTYNVKAGSTIATDGSSRHDQQGMSVPARDADDATEATPEGERDT